MMSRERALEEIRGFLKVNVFTADDINTPADGKGNYPLHLLCRWNAPPELVETVVRVFGADPNALNRDGLPPIAYAILHDSPALVRKMAELGAELYFPIDQERHFNAVIAAAVSLSESVLRAVLETGGGIHVNKGGIFLRENRPRDCKALHIAASNQSVEMIRLLMRAGAQSEEAAGAPALTPLQEAASNNRHQAIKVLLEEGADSGCRDSLKGWTALHHAIANEKYYAVKSLLEGGVNPETETRSGMTPLMLAAEVQRNPAILRLLIEAGADINRAGVTEARETPLMVAAARGNYEMVQELLQRGADTQLTDAFNKTAARHAESGNHYGIKQLIVTAQDAAEQKYFEKAYKRYKP